ncbi:MAG: hypothetical protein ACYSQZ_05355 [Planctomycetota bacterium]|jgi:hypothetical protein
MEQMTAQLVDLGMTGLLIGYLIRQNVKTAELNAELQSKYEALLERVVTAIDELKNRG